MIFAGQAIAQGDGSMARALLMVGGAVSALLAVRAARAGVFLTETAGVCPGFRSWWADESPELAG